MLDGQGGIFYTTIAERCVPRMQTEVAEIRLEAPPQTVWAVIADPGNVLRLAPPELRPIQSTNPPTDLTEGTIVEFNLRMAGLPITWAEEITQLQPTERMVSIQRSGPYRYWQHEQRLYPHLYGTIVEDRIDYEPIGGAIGLAATRALFRPRVDRWLAYRHTQLMHWFDRGCWLEGSPELEPTVQI